jgi:hypothetical protein
MELQALEKQKFQSKSKSSKFTIKILSNHHFIIKQVKLHLRNLKSRLVKVAKTPKVAKTQI